MIRLHGTEEQRQRSCPRLATCEIRSSFSMTEPHAGSDVQAIRTTAVRDGDEYVISGQKMWVTNGWRSSIVMLLAKTDPAAVPTHTGMTGFIIEKEPETSPPGLEIPMPGLKKLGYKGVESTELVFDGFRTPASSVLGGEEGVGKGFKYFMSGIEVGRVNVAARGVGVAQAALDDALGYAREREAFGKPIGHHQAVQMMLARMATRAEAARLLTRPGCAEEGLGRARRPRGRDGEVLRDGGGTGERARLHAHPRGLRVLHRVPAGALLPGRTAASHRRGLERDPAGDHRATAARARRELTLDFAIPEELGEIRAAVRELCAGFPGEYWRALEPDRYPTEFVQALTANGWLAALIPEEYGGAGLTITAASVILEEINAIRVQLWCLPRADVHDGHDPAARLQRAEGALPAARSPRASCACRPSA